MAPLTKADVRNLTQQAFDDPSATRWTSANLDLLTEVVLDTLTEAVLNTFPWATSQTDAIALSSGAIDTGSCTKRFFAVQKFLVGTTLYQPAIYNQSFPQKTYSMLNGSIVTSDTASGTANVTYSFFPTRYSTLSDGTAMVEYLQGHEAALAYLTAAWAMQKGGQEDIGQTGKLAEYAIDALLRHIARRYPHTNLDELPQISRQVVSSTLSMPLPAVA